MKKLDSYSPPPSKQIITLLYFFLLVFIPCFAAQDFYPFKQPIQQQRFQALTSEFRCLVCQNQNLAESNAPLAADLRQQIYQKILQNQSDQQIVEYLVARYGDTVLYKPPLTNYTIGLWFGPFLLLMLGLGYLLYYLAKRRV